MENQTGCDIAVAAANERRRAVKPCMQEPRLGTGAPGAKLALLLWVASFLLCSMGNAGPAQASPSNDPSGPISLEESRSELTLSWSSEACHISLSAYKADSLSTGTVQISRLCNRPYADQLKVVGLLVDAASSHPEVLSHARVLHWSAGETPEERVELIEAELTHPKRTRGGSISNELACQILRDAHVFAALTEIFKARGYKLTLESLEKAYKTQARNLARVGVDRAKLARPVAPQDWVLGTAQAWFRIERASPE